MANWPAMRPSLTTGMPAPKVSTTAICSSTRRVSRILSAWKSAKASAQSPPCRRKARPAQTSASRSLRCAPRRRTPAAARPRAALDLGQSARVGVVRASAAPGGCASSRGCQLRRHRRRPSASMGALLTPSRLVHGDELLGRRRVQRHRVVEMRLGGPRGHRHREALDDLGRILADHVAAQHPIARRDRPPASSWSGSARAGQSVEQRPEAGAVDRDVVAEGARAAPRTGRPRPPRAGRTRRSGWCRSRPRRGWR